MASPLLFAPWLVALLGAGDPIVAEPAPEHGASTGTDTGTGTAGTGATGETTNGGTTGATGGTGTTGGPTSTDTGGTTAGTAGTSTGNTTSGGGSSESSATAVTIDPTVDDATVSDGGSFVDGDITSYGPEDFIDEEGCDPDDEDPGCCDSAENNSDNFCHISRRGRDRVAIAVLLILLARPRRPRR